MYLTIEPNKSDFSYSLSECHLLVLPSLLLNYISFGMSHAMRSKRETDISTDKNVLIG